MGDSPSPVLSPDEDLSHVNDLTRTRMERVRELEQQRLRRVLAHSRTHVQGPGPVPDSTQQGDVSTQSGATRSPLMGSRSPDVGRVPNRSRVVNISHTRSATRSIQERDEDIQETVSETALPSQYDFSSDLKVSDKSYIEKLKQLIETSDSSEMRARYLRLLELEEAKMEDSQLPGGTQRTSRLSRSASVNDRRHIGRITRTRSTDQSGPVQSPSRRTLHESETAVSPRSGPLNIGFHDIVTRREEGLKKIEEIKRRREQGLPSVKSSNEMQTMMTREKIEPFSYVSASGPQSYSAFLTRRTSDIPVHYSSISELHEPYESEFSAMNPVTGSLENLHIRRPSYDVLPSNVPSSHTPAGGSTDNIYMQGGMQGLTYVDSEGITQCIPPSSPQYKQMRQPEPQSYLWQDQSDEVKASKKRSLLHKEGLIDHVLMECFDSEFTFEERICRIREKLYGSRVLIPSDKQPGMGQRGRPDGASEGTICAQGSSTEARPSDSTTAVKSQA